MAYKCKIFEAVNISLHFHKYCIFIHMCAISKDTGINKKIEIYPPSRESISGHGCKRTNMAAK